MYFIGSAQLADAPSRTANQAMEKLGLISIPPEFSRETHKVAVLLTTIISVLIVIDRLIVHILRVTTTSQYIGRPIINTSKKSLKIPKGNQNP
jgi:hypothetical protein